MKIDEASHNFWMMLRFFAIVGFLWASDLQRPLINFKYKPFLSIYKGTPLNTKRRSFYQKYFIFSCVQ
jgi:hypothetical protein